MTIWFGQHAGTEIADLPDHYLYWLVNEASQVGNDRDMWLDFISECEDELERRE